MEAMVVCRAWYMLCLKNDISNCCEFGAHLTLTIWTKYPRGRPQ